MTDQSRPVLRFVAKELLAHMAPTDATGFTDSPRPLEVETDLGSSVGMYQGDYYAATLPLAPITNPLSLDGRAKDHVWLIGQAPADTQGVETWRLVAHVAGDCRQAEITAEFWIGDWAALPEGVPTSELKRVLLPMVMQ